MDARAFRRTMAVLERTYPMKDWSNGMTAFEVLVSTVLSQSTTVANERRGLEGLRTTFGEITPERLASAQDDAIAAAIWHAGLARQKAPRIRRIAKSVLEAWNGRAERILELPIEAARAALTRLPGVGPKTADVVLAMAGGHPTFPVDTHVARIARRWNLVRSSDYESIRAALERRTPPEKRKSWHLAMIAHGRTLCRAHNPLCDECPVRSDCDWYRRVRSHRRLRGRRATKVKSA
ncbi:MAG TPA: endonuclease III [Thermoplasmata archaeon]|nr:endonuclease III [Thermoplasmata archaeon]